MSILSRLFKSDKSPKEIFVAIPVWGKLYIDTFLAVSLPSQLASRNAPYLSKHFKCNYWIYTTQNDSEIIKRSRSYQRLAELVNVNIKLIDDKIREASEPNNIKNKYDIKSDCYRHCLSLAEAARAPILMINADIVLSENFFFFVAKLLSQGKRLLELPGPRTLLSPMIAELRQKYDEKRACIEVTAKDLADLYINNMHPIEHLHIWNSERKAEEFHPSHLFWRVGTTGLVAHCFHLYPIMVWSRINGATFRSTIDDVLAESAAPDMNDTYIPQHDEVFCIELSSPDHFVGSQGLRGNIDSVAEFFLKFGTERNLKLLAQQFRIGGHDIPAQQWAETEKLAGEIIERMVQSTEHKTRNAAL